MPAQVLFISHEFWSIHTEPCNRGPKRKIGPLNLRLFPSGQILPESLPAQLEWSCPCLMGPCGSQGHADLTTPAAVNTPAPPKARSTNPMFCSRRSSSRPALAARRPRTTSAEARSCAAPGARTAACASTCCSGSAGPSRTPGSRWLRGASTPGLTARPSCQPTARQCSM